MILKSLAEGAERIARAAAVTSTGEHEAEPLLHEGPALLEMVPYGETRCGERV